MTTTATRPARPKPGSLGLVGDTALGRLLGLPRAITGYTVYRVEVPMRDGVILVADHYAPGSSGPAGTLLVRGPYGRAFPFSQAYARLHAARGYHVVLRDPETYRLQVLRYVVVHDCGRVINPKTARSQAIGGIIWGVGQALMEQSETDPAMGRFINRNYSGYLVPTCADIPALDVLFVGEFDEEASPIGGKGLGELTSVSVAPAIANAVYHATSKRIRDLPITLDKLQR